MSVTFGVLWRATPAPPGAEGLTAGRLLARVVVQDDALGVPAGRSLAMHFSGELLGLLREGGLEGVELIVGTGDLRQDLRDEFEVLEDLQPIQFTFDVSDLPSTGPARSGPAIRLPYKWIHERALHLLRQLRDRVRAAHQEKPCDWGPPLLAALDKALAGDQQPRDWREGRQP